MYNGHLAVLMTTDLFLDTEIIDALIERQYINPKELEDRHFNIGEVHVSEYKNIKIFMMFIKEHIDDRPMQADIRRALKAFKNVLLAQGIKNIGLIRDVAI